MRYASSSDGCRLLNVSVTLGKYTSCWPACRTPQWFPKTWMSTLVATKRSANIRTLRIRLSASRAADVVPWQVHSLCLTISWEKTFLIEHFCCGEQSSSLYLHPCIETRMSAESGENRRILNFLYHTTWWIFSSSLRRKEIYVSCDFRLCNSSWNFITRKTFWARTGILMHVSCLRRR